MIAQLEDESNETRSLLRQKVADAQKCIRELDKIPLRNDPRSEEDYIDMLIKEEENGGTDGYLDRIKELRSLKRPLTLQSQIGDNQPTSSVLGDADRVDEVRETPKQKDEYRKVPLLPLYWKK